MWPCGSGPLPRLSYVPHQRLQPSWHTNPTGRSPVEGYTWSWLRVLQEPFGYFQHVVCTYTVILMSHFQGRSHLVLIRRTHLTTFMLVLAIMEICLECKSLGCNLTVKHLLNSLFVFSIHLLHPLQPKKYTPRFRALENEAAFCLENSRPQCRPVYRTHVSEMFSNIW